MAKKPKPAPAKGAPAKSLKARALEETRQYVVITLYLWVLLALFAEYKRILLSENGINVWGQGYAIVNAMIFAKVVLLGEMLNLGARLKKQALIWLVLGKSFLFTGLLILFHIAEEAIRAWFESEPVGGGILNFGGGTWAGAAIYAALLFVTLVPLFAFREVADAVGKNAMWQLLFSREHRLPEGRV